MKRFKGFAPGKIVVPNRTLSLPRDCLTPSGAALRSLARLSLSDESRTAWRMPEEYYVVAMDLLQRYASCVLSNSYLAAFKACLQGIKRYDGDLVDAVYEPPKEHSKALHKCLTLGMLRRVGDTYGLHYCPHKALQKRFEGARKDMEGRLNHPDPLDKSLWICPKEDAMQMPLSNMDASLQGYMCVEHGCSLLCQQEHQRIQSLEIPDVEEEDWPDDIMVCQIHHHPYNAPLRRKELRKKGSHCPTCHRKLTKELFTRKDKERGYFSDTDDDEEDVLFVGRLDVDDDDEKLPTFTGKRHLAEDTVALMAQCGTPSTKGPPVIRQSFSDPCTRTHLEQVKNERMERLRNSLGNLVELWKELEPYVKSMDDMKPLLMSCGRPSLATGSEDPVLIHVPLNIQLRNTTKMHDYQEEAVKTMSNTSGCIILPCGTGKTIIALALCQGVLPAHKVILIVAHSHFSARENFLTGVRKHLNIPESLVVVVDGCTRLSMKKLFRARIIITTYSFYNPRGKKVNAVARKYLHDIQKEKIIMDEVHHLENEVGDRAVLDEAVKMYGLTATQRSTSTDLYIKYFPTRYTKIPSEIPQGIIELPIVQFVGINCTLPHGFKSDVIHQAEAHGSLPEIQGAALNLLNRYSSNTGVIVTSHYKKPFVDLKKQLTTKYSYMDGDMKFSHRRIAVDQFIRGETNILMTTSVGSEGLNVHRATMSIQISWYFGDNTGYRVLQSAGRLMRMGGGAAVYVFLYAKNVPRISSYAMTCAEYLQDHGYTTRLC